MKSLFQAKQVNALQSINWVINTRVRESIKRL